MNDVISQIESKLQTFLRNNSCKVNTAVYGYRSMTPGTCGICEAKNKAMIYMVGDILPLLSSLKYQTMSNNVRNDTTTQIESKLQLFLRNNSCGVNSKVFCYNSQSPGTCSTCEAKNKTSIHMVGDILLLLSSLKYQTMGKPVDTVNTVDSVTIDAVTTELLQNILQRLTNIEKKLRANGEQECSYEDDKR